MNTFYLPFLIVFFLPLALRWRCNILEYLSILRYHFHNPCHNFSSTLFPVKHCSLTFWKYIVQCRNLPMIWRPCAKQNNKNLAHTDHFQLFSDQQNWEPKKKYRKVLITTDRTVAVVLAGKLTLPTEDTKRARTLPSRPPLGTRLNRRNKLNEMRKTVK